MRRFIYSVLLILTFQCLWGCKTSNTKNAATLQNIVEDERVISLDYSLYGKGVFSVDLQSPNGDILPFLIDTGATKSALYISSVKKLNLDVDYNLKVMVHGMTDLGERPLVKVPQLIADSVALENLEMAVLETPESMEDKSIIPAGILGMDILGGYRIYVNSDRSTFSLIPIELPAPHIPFDWQSVQLKQNPYSDRSYNLHFLEIRLGNQMIPALMDTGSEVNLMNWNTAKFPMLKRARTRLFEEWQLSGAIGEFEPVFKIRAKNFRSGQKYWDDEEFLVADLDGLEILGIASEPLLIAGSPLFAEQTFYMDFEKNILKFRSEKDEGRGGTLSSRTTVFNKDNGVQY